MLSPPRLSYSQFCTSTAAAEFLETVRAAEEHVAAGQPNALLDVRIPLPFVVTAAGYLEKYGPNERYNFLNFIGTVPWPTLITFGSIELEKNVAFRDLPTQLASNTCQVRPRIEVIPDADHFYSNRRVELTTVVEQWIRGSREQAVGAGT